MRPSERWQVVVRKSAVFLAGLAQPVYHFAVQRNTLGLILPFGFGFRQSGIKYPVVTGGGFGRF